MCIYIYIYMDYMVKYLISYIIAHNELLHLVEGGEEEEGVVHELVKEDLLAHHSLYIVLYDMVLHYITYYYIIV